MLILEIYTQKYNTKSIYTQKYGEATEIVDFVADDGFFLLNISATFWECLAARFKSFLPKVYTYNAQNTTSTLMATVK